MRTFISDSVNLILFESSVGGWGFACPKNVIHRSRLVLDSQNETVLSSFPR